MRYHSDAILVFGAGRKVRHHLRLPAEGQVFLAFREVSSGGRVSTKFICLDDFLLQSGGTRWGGYQGGVSAHRWLWSMLCFLLPPPLFGFIDATYRMYNSRYSSASRRGLFEQSNFLDLDKET